MNELDLRVTSFVREHLPALPEGACVLACSGGADSTAMVALLCEHDLIDRERAVVAHFDHHLRGVEAADADRAAVRALSARYGLRMVEGSWDAPRPGEDAARRARYTFLREVAGAHGAHAVVTGHTADDQAETVLMHALRGAGLHGLAGMSADAPWPLGGGAPRLARPLLAVRRDETRAYCAAHGLAWRDDPSNQDRAFLRNRLRLDVLPRLEAASPGARDALLALAGASRSTLASVEREASAALTRDDTADGAVTLDRATLRAMPPELAAAAWRIALVRLLGDARDFERRHYALLAAVADASTGATFTLPRGVVVTIDPDEVVVSRGPLRAPAIPSDLVLPLPFSGKVGGWTLDIRPCAPAEGQAIALPPQAVVRRRRPGDRIRPRGMDGTRKLQDLFVDRKVPRRLRDAVPVIATDAAVWWTPFGVAAPAPDGVPHTVRAAPGRG